MVIEFFVALLMLWLFWLIFKRHILLSHLKRFPCVEGYPIIGSVLHFANPRNCIKNLLGYLKKYHGESVILYLGPQPYLLVFDEKLSEIVLGSNKILKKASEYKLLSNWFGDGLLTSTGHKWRSHRKILTPSFHYKILENFVEVFDKESCVLVKKLEKEKNKNSFDIFKYVSLCTLDIICETAMGTTVKAQDNPDSEVVKSIKNMCDIIYVRCFSLFMRIDFLYHLTKYYTIEKSAIKVLRKFSNDVIETRKEILFNNKLNNETNGVNEFGVKEKNTFLDVLLQSTVDGRYLTNLEIREEVDTFIFEGHDTTAVAISLILYSLSKNLDVQNRAWEEIKEIYQNDKEKRSTYEDLQCLKYLEMVIKEGLRMYPSVPAFSRILTEDISYDNGILPKGLVTVLIPYILHRSSKLYPNPEKFDPERFTIENCLKRHPYAYVPFSAGPRNCIGQKFAMLEMKSTLSKILRFYEILPASPDYNPDMSFKLTLQSDNGIQIRLKERSA